MSNTRKRLKAKRGTKPQTSQEKHIAAIQAEKKRLENMTPEGIRRIVIDYPPLSKVIYRLHQLSEAADPTTGRHLNPNSAHVTTDSDSDGIVAHGNVATHHSGIATLELRRAQERITRRLDQFAYELLITLGGADDDIHHEKPRCQKMIAPKVKCPLFGLRQPLGTTECAGCGKPFA